MNDIPRADLPTGWTWVPLDSLAEVLVSTVDKKSYEGETPVRLCNYTDVYYNDAITGNIEFMQATASADQVSRFAVTAGDVPITKDSEASDDIGRPSYVPTSLPGVVYGYHLAIYRPHDPSIGPFIRYLFEESRTRGELEVRTPGVTRVGLSRDTLRNLRVPYPGPRAAHAIADYLDHETAEIDALVDDLQRMAQLSAERLAARISKSLASARSQYPLRRLKSVTSLRGGNGFPHAEQGQSDLELPFFKVGALAGAERGILNRAEHTISRATASRLGATIFQPGTSVMAKIGAALRLGRVATLAGPSCIDNNLLGITPGEYLEPDYLRFTLASVSTAPFALPGAVPSLDVGAFRELTIPVPPLSKQLAIIERVEHLNSENDETVADLTRAITLAKERRAALITAAVTGQIDVTATHRPAAEQLEDDIKELT